jgi:hypothetical protein
VNNNPNEQPGPTLSSRIWLFLGLGLLLLLGLQFLSSGAPLGNEVPLSELAAAIRNGTVTQIIVQADTKSWPNSEMGTCSSAARNAAWASAKPS